MSEPWHEKAVMNELLRVCIDGHIGFLSAADIVEDPSLKSELMSYSVQRREFAAHLQEMIDPPQQSLSSRGSRHALAHEEWVRAHARRIGRDRQAILSVCEKGEEAAEALYKQALLQGLTPKYLNLVTTQSQIIEQTRERIKKLRNPN